LLILARIKSSAFIADFALGHLVYYFFANFTQYSAIEGLYSTIHQLSFFQLLQEEVPFFDQVLFLKIFFVTALLRTYFGAMFGRSLFQMFMGIESEENDFWKKRKKAIVMGLFEVFLGPLNFIVDLPILFGKRGLKEMISGSTMTYEAKDSYLLWYAVCFTFAVVAIPVSPILKNLVFEDFSNREVLLSTIKVEEEIDFKNFRSYRSNRFKFSSFSSLEKSGMILLPDYSLRLFSEDNRKELRPFLSIFDTNLNLRGMMSVDKNIYLLDVLQVAKKGNPLFAANFPQLNLVLKNKRSDYFLKKAIKEGKNPPYFNKKLKAEMILLVKSSLELSPFNIFSHILTFGPFIGGFQKLQQNLKKLAASGTWDDISIANLGDENFLMFKKGLDNSGNDKNAEMMMIPLGTHNSVSWKFSWEKSEDSQKSLNNFLRLLFGGAEFFFDYQLNYSMPKSKSDLSSFQFIDFYLSKTTSHKDLEDLEEYLILEVNKLAENKDESIKSWAKKIFSRLRKVPLLISREGSSKELQSKLEDFQ
jgi:hypothetical protein